MDISGFTKWLVEVMLSWSRWLANSLWGAIGSGYTEGGMLSWFARNWLVLLAILVAAGVVGDWLIWMIRWRPYWLWFNKKQIIYADPPKRKKRQPARPVQREARPHFQGRAHAAREDEFEADPFSYESLDDRRVPDMPADEDYWGPSDDVRPAKSAKKKKKDAEYF